MFPGRAAPVMSPVMRTALPIVAGWLIVLPEYISWLQASNRPKTTIYLRTYHLRRFAHESAPDPFSVTLDDLIGYMAGHDWSAHTRRSVRSSLVGFYTWAHATGRTPINPAVLLPAIHVNPGKPRPASDAAVTFGLASVDQRTRLMIRLAAGLGLRCCEVAVVHSSDLSGGAGSWSILVHGKGDKQRVLPITDDLAAELHRLPSGYAFTGQIDGHLSASYVSKLISRALPAGTTAHPLRHRFASRAYVGSGGDIRAVQELLGHASVATTQIYTAVSDDTLRRAVQSAA